MFSHQSFSSLSHSFGFCKCCSSLKRNQLMGNHNIIDTHFVWIVCMCVSCVLQCKMDVFQLFFSSSECYFLFILFHLDKTHTHTHSSGIIETIFIILNKEQKRELTLCNIMDDLYYSFDFLIFYQSSFTRKMMITYTTLILLLISQLSPNSVVLKRS